MVIEELLRRSAESADLLARVHLRSRIVRRLGRHTEPGRPPIADPQLLPAGKLGNIVVHDPADAPGKPPDRWMRLFSKFIRRNVAQRAV